MGLKTSTWRRAVARFEPGQRVRASRPARVGTTIAAATVCSVIRVAAEPVSNPNVRSGTKDSTVSATAVRTNVAAADAPCAP